MADLDLLLEQAKNADAEFIPYAEYRQKADAINVYFSDQPDRSKRLTDHVTLFVAIGSDEIVGCRIKGVSRLDLPNYVKIDHGRMELWVFFWKMSSSVDDAKSREVIEKLGEEAYQKNLMLAPQLD